MDCVKNVLLVFWLGWLLAACAEPAADSLQSVDKAATDHTALSVRVKADNPEFRYMDGELYAKGLLLAYWETLYVESEPVTLAEAQPWQRLQLRFYPDSSAAMDALAKSAGVNEVQRIFTYRTRIEAPVLDELDLGYAPNEQDALTDALAPFKDVPDGFLQHREGFVVQGVRARLEGLISFVEGDARFVYGQLTEIESLHDTPHHVLQLPDFNPATYLGQPWRLFYKVEEPTPLYSSPQQNSDVITLLQAGTGDVEKLKTVSADWVQVQVADSNGHMQSGYLPKTSLWVIN